MKLNVTVNAANSEKHFSLEFILESDVGEHTFVIYNPYYHTYTEWMNLVEKPDAVIEFNGGRYSSWIAREGEKLEFLSESDGMGCDTCQKFVYRIEPVFLEHFKKTLTQLYNDGFLEK